MDTTLRDPLIGRLLDSRYRVEQRLAAGGMATVYRGLDTRLDRVVALKVMHPALAADADFVGRFIREAKAAARLAHPNVVNVFDQGTDGGHVFLAMEYVPGCTLRDVLRDRGALSIRATLDILEPVLAALGAAHRAGLVHRDVKPENVLITDGGLVKVADFGLVRTMAGDASATSTTAVGTVLGTVSYLAPEQVAHGAADPRSDVWACGALLYETLTGAKPHPGDTAAQVLYRRLHEDVPPPSELVPGLPPELDAIVAGATARDPGQRYHDAVDLLAALQTLRPSLTPGELDAEPPAARSAAPHCSPSESTAVLPPVVAEAAPERTAVMELPPDLALPPELALRRGGRRGDGDDLDGAPHGAAGPRGRPRGLLTVGVLLGLLALGALATWLLAGALYTTTPSVLGLGRERARATLDHAGLTAAFREDYSETVPRGRVVETDPPPGGRVRRHARVEVVLSEGPERHAVPDLAGVPLDAARQRLSQARLTPGTVSRAYSDAVPAGSVVRTEPAAGHRLRRDAPVSLVVSRGPAPVPVPQVAGEPVEAAQAQLTASGFAVRIDPGQVYSDSVPEGSVVSQDPGGRARRGATVTLTVSRGPHLYPVPDVRGQPVQDASDALKKAGFEVRVIDLDPIGDATVRNESPGPDEQRPKGTEITLWAF